MYGDNDFRTWRDFRGDPIHIHLPIGGFAVHQHRRGAYISDGVDGGDHGERGEDDFVAGSQSQGGKGQMQGYGAIVA